MKILISPYAKKLPDCKKSAKDYPYWNQFIKLLKDKKPNAVLTQIGLTGDVKLEGIDEYYFDHSLHEIAERIKECDTFISVDNFFHHWATYIGKAGYVIWSKSDPLIFGDSIHCNILKDRKHLRPDQFGFWKDCPYDEGAFMKPLDLIKEIT